MDMFTNIFRERVLFGEKASAEEPTRQHVLEEVEDCLEAEEAEEVEEVAEVVPVKKELRFLEEKRPSHVLSSEKFEGEIDSKLKGKSPQAIHIDGERFKNICTVLNIDSQTFAIKGPISSGTILFFPTHSNLIQTNLEKLLTSSCLKQIQHKVPDDKVKLISRAKRKAIRKTGLQNSFDLQKWSKPHHNSGSWQTFVAEEFSRRMKEFVNGSRLESLSWISRQEKEAKCQCCNYFEETHTRKCLVQEKCEKLRIGNDVIFSCDVTEGHLRGDSNPVRLQVSHKEILLHSEQMKLRRKILLGSIQGIEIDEFCQICCVVFQPKKPKDSENCCVMLENFGGKLPDFLFVFEYLRRSQNVNRCRCEKLISQFSWNYRLRLPIRSHPIIFVCPVSISVQTLQRQDDVSRSKETSLMFSLSQPCGDPTIEKRVKKSNWLLANFCLKINTLYLYQNEEDELPKYFWILNENCFITTGDEIEERPNMLKIIPEEGMILNLSFPSSSEMFLWINYLQAARQFKAHDFNAREVSLTKVEDCFMAVCPKSLLLFNCDAQTIVNFRKQDLTGLTDIKIRTEKKQCILKFGDNFGDGTTWKMTFLDSSNLHCLKTLLKK